MTQLETRQLGIEFERRVQTMIPEKEYDKLDTDTIYSFLNQYQDQYVRDIYRSLDSIPSGTKISARLESILQSLLQEEEVLLDDSQIKNEDGSVIYTLPEKLYMYIRSTSKVSSSYNFKGKNTDDDSIKFLPNELISQNELWKVLETPNNNLRILRHPVAALSKYDGENQTLTVVYDRYTTPLGIKIIYYKRPKYFSILDSIPCELPTEAFDDIVTGAVELYVDYVAGAEAKKRRQQEALREQQRENNRKQNNED